MDFLPVPTKRHSWIVALLLATTLFLIYYLYIYSFLLETYKTQFNDGTYLIRQNDEDVRLKSLTIKASIPRYVYRSEKIWMYISVENSGDQIMNMTLYLPLSSMSETFLLPSLTEDDVYEATLTMDIKPHSTLVSRIPLVVQSNIVKIESIWLQASVLENGEIISLTPVERKSLRGELVPEVNPWKAMKHSFLENILLPPWSNGFILVLAAFSSYLTQNKRGFKNNDNDTIPSGYDSNPDNEPDIFTVDWWKCLGFNIMWAVIVLIVVMLVITIMFDFIALIIIAIFCFGVLEFIKINKNLQSTKGELSEELKNIHNKDSEEDELRKWAARIEKKDYSNVDWIWKLIVKIQGHPKEIRDLVDGEIKRINELVDKRKKGEEEKQQQNKPRGKDKNKSKLSVNYKEKEQGKTTLSLRPEEINLNSSGNIETNILDLRKDDVDRDADDVVPKPLVDG